jgi:tetratricopeptide (TPR) repeat protein
LAGGSREIEAQTVPDTAVGSSSSSNSKSLSVDSEDVKISAASEAAAVKREGVAVAQALVQAYPEDALAYALLGSAHYNIGQSEPAVRHLKRCLELNPNQIDAYEILARVAAEKGDLEEAVRLGEEAIKRSPAHPEILTQLGRTYLDLGRATDAVAVLLKAVTGQRPNMDGAYLLGQAYLQSKDFARAKDAFQRVIAISPRHTQAFFGLYTASLRLGEADEAEKFREEFQKLQAADSKAQTDRSAQEDTRTGLPLVRTTMARTLFGASQIYRSHGNGDQALGLLRKSALFDPENPMYRAAAEAVFQQRKAPQEGLKFFHDLVQEQPQSSYNHLFLGRFQSRVDNFEGAESAYLKAQELAPGRSEPPRSLVDLYLRKRRKLDVALVLARQVVEIDPSGSNYHLLALACANNQDRVGALAAIRQAIARNPDEANYRQLLQQLEKAP